jgi:hypothetical protein
MRKFIPYSNKRILYKSKSNIHGEGLYSRVDIQKGTSLSPHYIPKSAGGFNFSKNPNTKIRVWKGEERVYATRNIQRGEEMTTPIPKDGIIYPYPTPAEKRRISIENKKDEERNQRRWKEKGLPTNLYDYYLYRKKKREEKR